jgi:hypothetical protein
LSKRKVEFRLLPQRLVPLAPDLEREAVGLLTDMLLDAAAKRRGGASGGASNGVFGGAIPGADALGKRAGRAREVA